MTDDLAEAERRLNAQPVTCCRGPAWLAVRASEFDRLRLVEQAASEFIQSWRPHPSQNTWADRVPMAYSQEKLDALAAAVRTETP